MLGVAGAGPRIPSDPIPLVRAPSALPALAERAAWAILASADQVGPMALIRIVDALGSASRAISVAADVGGPGLVDASRAPGQASERGISLAQAEAIAARARNPDPILRAIERLHLRIVLLEDQDYPSRLLEVDLPPPVLFVWGDVAALDPVHAVAVVGTRHPSETGRAMGSRIAMAIADRGATVVSGLALGIDGIAHTAAVRLRLPTVAVLGGGHERIYPPAHGRLAAEIVEYGGAVLSEHVPEVTPTRGTFPRRNRLISGLSDSTVVIEAPRHSGALITAHWALDQGRGCFLVPSQIGARTGQGSLDFLRAYPGQARIVASVEDLLEDLGLIDEPSSPGRGPVQLRALGLSTVEVQLAELLRTDAATADDLVHATGLPVATVLGAITLLEMRKLVVGAYGRYRPTVDLAGSDLPRGPGRTSGKR